MQGNVENQPPGVSAMEWRWPRRIARHLANRPGLLWPRWAPRSGHEAEVAFPGLDEAARAVRTAQNGPPHLQLHNQTGELVKDWSERYMWEENTNG